MVKNLLVHFDFSNFWVFHSTLACGSRTREVSPDAFVHLARLHRGLDHLVLSQDLWQQAPEEELSAQKDFHGRAVVEAE